ncbi:Hypothetical predicted protein [Mytilus galloprovincialis]|uniref:Uncharacterized protein n=1 Tax=Mytilus galloprovincialis TaxID=29158 RepID=A0A8B6FFG8_MYTGA|nr:Hypothetical predicted protein [Mytilus galloprovincialis]
MATIDSTPFCDICQHRDLNKSAEEYCPQCEEALCDRKRNLTELREQKRVISEHIKDKRNEINVLLAHLEEELLEKVSALEKTNCEKIAEVITKLEDEKEKVEGIQKDVESVKMFASDLQIFMGTKAFQ